MGVCWARWALPALMGLAMWALMAQEKGPVESFRPAPGEEMPVRVISLPKDAARRRAARARLGAARDLRFVRAVDGSRLDGGWGPLTRGETGCFASHLGVWRAAARRQRAVLVMEDDADARLPELWASLRGLDMPAAYGVLWLGINNPPPGAAAATQVRPLEQDAFGTHAYLLSPEGAAHLVSRFEAQGPADASGEVVPVDLWMSRVAGLGAYWVDLVRPLPGAESNTQGIR